MIRFATKKSRTFKRPDVSLAPASRKIIIALLGDRESSWQDIPCYEFKI